MRINDKHVEIPEEAGEPADAQLRMLTGIVDQISHGVAVVDNDGCLIFANRAFTAMHGYAGESLIGQHHTLSQSPSDRSGPVTQLIAAALRDGNASAEVVRCRRDGTSFPAQVTLSLLHDEHGELIGRVLSLQDNSQHRQLEEQLRRQALHDPLTGLANRRLLLDRLTHALERIPRHGSQVAALFVDLDAFKAVNDAFGHAVGDQVLVTTAQRMKRCLRPEDTLARLGGDEFVIVLGDVLDADEPLQVAHRIRNAVAEPIRLGHNQLRISASVGLATTTTGTAEDLLQTTDTAMYQAKAKGKDRVEANPTYRR